MPLNFLMITAVNGMYVYTHIDIFSVLIVSILFYSIIFKLKSNNVDKDSFRSTSFFNDKYNMFPLKPIMNIFKVQEFFENKCDTSHILMFFETKNYKKCIFYVVYNYIVCINYYMYY